MPFDDVVTLIREQGCRRKFGRATYIYLDIDKFQYWTMGGALNHSPLALRSASSQSSSSAGVKARVRSLDFSRTPGFYFPRRLGSSRPARADSSPRLDIEPAVVAFAH